LCLLILHHFVPESLGEVHGVKSPLNAGGEAGTEIEPTACNGGFAAGDSEDAFGHEASKGLTDADWASARLFVEGNQSTSHQGTVCCPWWAAVGQPLGEECDLHSEAMGFSAKPKKPVGEGDSVDAAGTRCSLEVGGCPFNRVARNVEGYGFRTDGVVLERGWGMCVNGRVLEGWMFGP
jgi:hypothetical protein